MTWKDFYTVMQCAIFKDAKKLARFHPENSAEKDNTGEILCTFPPALKQTAKA
jgi:hypothetical protein